MQYALWDLWLQSKDDHITDSSMYWGISDSCKYNINVLVYLCTL